MPGNDVMDIIGVNHSLYLVLYSIFLLVYVNLFYVINEFKRKKAKKERLENNN